MSIAAGAVPASAPPQAMRRSRHWLLAALCFALFAGALLYLPTFAHMVRIWLSSDTYLHGFLILPISAVLVWRLRGELGALPWRPASAGFGVLLLLGIFWFVAVRTEVLVVEQLAAVAMLPALLYTFAGPALVQRIAFPLVYLVFAVPMGEELVPALMEFTADFTVGALRLSGISVFREGLLFSTSQGDFAVEKACSGVRYLTASLAVGALYAYLTYRSPLRRAVFIGLSALVPVVANGVRAYLIVVIAHVSNMQVAVGIDHVIYGWIFFGVVMLGLFAVGRWFGERDEPGSAAQVEAGATTGGSEPVSSGHVMTISLLAILAVAAGPIANLAFARAPALAGALPALASLSGEWQGPVIPAVDWRPAYSAADQELFGRYESAGRLAVDIALIYYSARGTGDLGAVDNRIAGPAWREFRAGTEHVALAGGGQLELRSSDLQFSGGRRVVWWLYLADGTQTTSPYVLKGREAASKLAGDGGGASLLALSVAYEDDAASARDALRDFLAGHFAQLSACAQGLSDAQAICAARGLP